MSTIKFEFPCGLKIEVEDKILKKIGQNERIYCPTHGKRCYRRQQVAKLHKLSKLPGILTPN